MKIDKIIGNRYKEKPSDSYIESHAIMIRGGYIKPVANGIFSLYNVTLRIIKKIENIIREEMNLLEGQEVLLPVVMPAALWQESGRYENVGSELVRFSDRNDKHLVLGMTHEEAAVHLVKEYGQAYGVYPFMIYQFQTKFRDEGRPRGGLIRVREFIMKDAYSFHTSYESLDEFYEYCYHAYERIFARVGIPEVQVVSSDSGMMGGTASHEFMLITPIGEDAIVTCENCDYKSNMEAAENIVINEDNSVTTCELEKHYTPNISSVEDLCRSFDIDASQICKAVVYITRLTKRNVIVFLRGDMEVNETKVRNWLKEDIMLVQDGGGVVWGYIGPYKINNGNNIVVLFDRSLQGKKNLCCGANEINYHYIGLNIERDCGTVSYLDLTKAKDGGICPNCGEKKIKIVHGIEVGNIFKLGDKYTRSMNMQYIDANGERSYPIMGCYGIGLGRLIASICEVKRDEHGPIWPMSISPWQVHICCIRSDEKQIKNRADDLYKILLNHGLEVVYDDRMVSAGIMFSDADLLGIPIRVVFSPRNYMNGVCEIVARDKSFRKYIEFEKAFDEIVSLKDDLMSRYL